jgi:hypothetical protein
MKAEIAAVVACLAVPCPTEAQEAHTTPRVAIRHEAPIGHRQPTVAGVQRAQAEKGQTGSVVAPAKSSDIDRRLIICQGC